MAGVVVERRVSPERSVGPSHEYEVRLLTDQFNSSTSDLDKATRRLPDNYPTEAYDLMHQKWVGARKKAWSGIGGKPGEKIQAWAKGRAKAFLSVINSGNFSQDLFDGLRVIGLNIEDPYTVSEDELQGYFSSTFYPTYAGNKDHSVAALGDKFFDECLIRKDRKDKRVGAKKAEQVMKQLKAAEKVLAPILEEDTYTKLWHVMQARVDNGLGNLKPEDILTPVSDHFRTHLGYFEPQPVITAGPTVARAAVAEVGAPVGRVVPAGPAAVELAGPVVAEAVGPITEPKPHVLTIEGGPDEFIQELNDKLRVDPDKSNLTVVFPDEAVRGYLVQAGLDDIDVLSQGSAQRDEDRENVINITGLKIKFKGEPDETSVTLDLSLENDGEDAIKAFIHKVINERGVEFLDEARGYTERGPFKNVTEGFKRKLDTDTSENAEWQPRRANIGKTGIEVEFYNISPLTITPQIPSIPPGPDEDEKDSLGVSS